jgi:hypothetical protein
LEGRFKKTLAEHKEARSIESAKRAQVVESLVKWRKDRSHLGKIGTAECSGATGFFHRPGGPPQLQFLDVVPPFIDIVEKGLANLSPQVLDDLRNDWEKEHLMVTHSTLPRLPGCILPKNPSRCLRYGRCLCKNPKLNRITLAFARMMRQAFHKDM